MSQIIDIKVKKPGGGSRMQRVRVLASGRYKFVSNDTPLTSRKKASTNVAAKKTKRRKKTTSKALVRRSTSAVTHRRGGGRRRRSGGGKVPLIPVALAAAGLAFLTGKSGPKQVQTVANKIPGAKTFGPLAVLGGAAYAVDHFGVYRSKWLRLAGVVGVTAAAIKVGTEGSSFKWVGDSDDIGDYDLADIEGDDDLSDIEGDDDLSDLEGDDDLGDEEG